MDDPITHTDTIPDDPLDLPPSSPRRSSLPTIIANAASGVRNYAAAAATLLGDPGLRKKGSEVIASGASMGLQNFRHSIQSGASTIQKGLYTVGQGPRQLQSVLARLSRQIEEQRLKILLEEQRDSPVDIQVGFQVYEDAPQELRSRLWMALLEHPELSATYNTVLEKSQPATYPSHRDAEKREMGENDVKELNVELDQENKQQIPDDEREGGGNVNAVSAPVGSTDNDIVVAGNDSIDDSGNEDKTHQEWEMVTERAAQRWRQGLRLLSGSSLHRIEPWNNDKEEFRQHIMTAMASIEWPIPPEPDQDGRYATLLQISIGQEEVDDLITKDIHRTFPEYPLFAFEQGQQALFRVLKAYSLNDLETGYCQGMAYIAGLTLFFVPEEAAFQLLCRLLSEKGPNLRRHYLPGLRGLKVELRVFELLLSRYLPKLKAHLEAHGAVPVLYAAQWFLSSFSCPFPVGFACRLVDCMLVENSDSVLMKTALAIMAECEPELLMQEDFEELLTYLKVEPVQWSVYRLRKVLNAAIHDSPITKEELCAVTAEAEAMEDSSTASLPPDASPDSPSLSPSSSLSSTVKVSPRKKKEKEGREHDGKEEDQNQEVVTKNMQAGVGSLPSAPNLDITNDDDSLLIEAELRQHEAELDTAFLDMVVELDNTMFGDSAGAEETYGQALWSAR